MCTPKLNDETDVSLALGTVLGSEKDVIKLIEKTLDETVFEYTSLDVLDIVYDLRVKGSDMATIKSMIQRIVEGKLHWKSKIYAQERLEEEEQNNFIIKPFEVSEGVLTCKCGSKKVYSYQKQSRSADEPMSTYATCVVCKHSWVYSG